MIFTLKFTLVFNLTKFDRVCYRNLKRWVLELFFILLFPPILQDFHYAIKNDPKFAKKCG